MRHPPSSGDCIHRWLAGLSRDLRERCFSRPDGLPWDDFEAMTSFAVRQEVSLELSRRSAYPSAGTAAVSKSTAGASAGPSARPKPNGHARRGGKRKGGPSAGNGASGEPKKPKLTKFGTSSELYEQQKANGRCFYCDKKHMMWECPHKADGEAGRASQGDDTAPSHKMLSWTIRMWTVLD
jgi:hypothetical protein